MNKAITDGIVFTPTPYADGLGVWSRGDGTPGSDTYDGYANAAFVPADQDFGGALEVLKADSVQKLRYMGQTPLLPGCYLRITARVKAISGNLPAVRIAGYALNSGGAHVAGLTEVGPSVQLSSYGEVVEVSAIVGAGNRGGVDMIWGTVPVAGHFGLDLTGPSGGIVRIDDIAIEDVTGVYLRDLMGIVDVRDFGAVGDGVTDDSAAFEAADAASNGRTVVIPEGTFHLGESVTFENEVEFHGTVTQPRDKIFSLQKNFDLPSYIDAFGDDVEAFKKAFQALLNNAQHDSLDMGGRKVNLTEPLDMQAAVPNKATYATRRVIRNGQFEAKNSTGWDSEVNTSLGTYSINSPYTLSNVTNVANIPVGSLVEGVGVGREVYVRSKNVAAQSITLSQPFFDAEGTQTFTFTRFKYLLDFSGFGNLAKFVLEDCEFQCLARCSGINLAPAGIIFQVKDCFITRPLDRGITSTGEGCQGMQIDRCQFLSDEGNVLTQDRRAIALNVNANDAKIRDNRVMHFRHFAVMAGAGYTFVGNHWFGGDDAQDGLRLGGLILTNTNCKSIITGNYIDNNFIEWSNEHDPRPELDSEFSYGGLTITGNIFTVNDAASFFKFIVIKPHGAGHYINGLSVTGNVFRSLNGTIDRVEMVDTTYADLDLTRSYNIAFTNNVFNAVSEQVRNPLVMKHDEGSESDTWVIETAPMLPFGGRVRTVEAVQPEDGIRNASNVRVYTQPHADVQMGPDGTQVHLKWSEPVRGKVILTARMDAPI